MITFRPKVYVQKDLIPEAIEYLTSKGVRPNLITAEEADEVSKVNSRSMVLTKFIQNERGKFEIEVQEKEGYRYTQKLFEEIYKMKILNVDKKNRKLCAENDYLGKALDAILILGRKYNLSIVTSND